MTLYIKEVNAITGVEIEREMNAEELKSYKNDQLILENKEIAKDLQITQKAALLERLGITEDEARLLLG